LTDNPKDAFAVAQAVAEAMYPRDHAAHALGLQLAEVRPAWARVEMTVRQDMLNGHGVCHGGLLFTLADTAFAYACNSSNHNTVASACTIEFVRPGHLGDRLVAIAHERTHSGRSGVYDVEVVNQQGEMVAMFRGRLRRAREHPRRTHPCPSRHPPPATSNRSRRRAATRSRRCSSSA
jgi:acyl-CoA thioesterase